MMRYSIYTLGCKVNSCDSGIIAEILKNAGFEECGDYESHKDYEFEASSTGVTVTAPATFSDRSADLEFVFDENMTLEQSMLITA